MRRLVTPIVALLCFSFTSSMAGAEVPMATSGAISMQSMNAVRMAAPALEKYTNDCLFGEVWKRPGLAPRDRSIVTLAVLITRTQTIDMPFYLNLALDNGVKPSEISELITHLAFYAGWESIKNRLSLCWDGIRKRNKRSPQFAISNALALRSMKLSS